MILDLLIEKANRCLPATVKAFAQFPMPWEGEDGVLHEPLPDMVLMRIRRDPLGETMVYVDAMVSESDAQLSDQDFNERIVKPMLAVLESNQA